MERYSRWSSDVLAALRHLPLVRRIDDQTLRQALLTLASAIFFMLAGGVLGSLNRGPVGTLIGAVSGSLLGAMLGGLVVTGVARLSRAPVPRATVEAGFESQDHRYLPGETIEGHIRIATENSFRTTGGRVYLTCRGFYTYDAGSGENGTGPIEFHRETREYVTMETPVVPPGRIKEGLSLRYPFTLTMPRNGLPTHHGYACEVRWTLHTVIDTPGGPLMAPPQELRLEALPPAVDLAVRGYQSITSSQVAQLTLALPRAVYAEGETITGHVRVSPIESFDADELRVLLLRIENTAVGHDHIVYIDRWDPETGNFRGHSRSGGRGTTYVWLENDITLARTQRFGIAAPEEFSFSLEIPVEWRPTMSTADGGVIWKVGVILARAEGSDVRAFHEVIVHSSTPEITGAFS